MTNTAQTMIVAAGMAVALLIGLPARDVTAGDPPGVACEPATVSAVPAEYLFYHALVAPAPALSGKRSIHAPCKQQKVIRT